jgi:death-on-curing protein
VKEPRWLDERDALTLHEKLLLAHGGGRGLRDEGLLRAALARPRQLFAYSDKPDVIAMAAAYTAGIIQNHPFIDGNKRVGFVLGVLFLEINGYAFKAAEEEAAQAVIGLAAGELDEPAYQGFLRLNVTSKRKR